MINNVDLCHAHTILVMILLFNDNQIHDLQTEEDLEHFSQEIYYTAW